MNNFTEQFRDAIRATGLTPPNSISADGKIHRFSSNGKPRDDSGWYVAYTDGIPAGKFGCWREGFTQIWFGNSDGTMTVVEREACRQRAKHMKVQREADEAQRHQAMATEAKRRWNGAENCTAHAYLTRKGVGPHGVKIEANRLLIPMRDTTGALHSLQTISSEGNKLFMPGGRVTGCYHSIGRPNGVLIVCEGYATAASIHECTNHAVAVAFTAGNILAVTLALRAKYPALKLVIAADDDHQTPRNPGMTRAMEAAHATGATLAVPAFKAVTA
jgi:putative DNA primase/helicase